MLISVPGKLGTDGTNTTTVFILKDDHALFVISVEGFVTNRLVNVYSNVVMFYDNSAHGS